MEYPFFLLREPVVEWNIFGDVDHSPNLVHSVATSDWTHRRWLERSRLGRSSSLIYPGVPEPSDAPSMRQELGIAPDVVVFGFHQRDDDNIYGEHALRAYAKALPRLSKPTAFLILGGSKKYHGLVDALALDVRVLPIAKDSDTVSRFLKTLDVFAHSGGAGEALGVVFQEAMMHGLPSITMRVPGRADGQVATMAGSGIVTDTIDEYADAIVALADSSETRQRLGKVGHEVAISKYAIPSVGLAFSSLLAKIFDQYSTTRFEPHRGRLLMALESNVLFRAIRSGVRRAIRR